MRITQHFPALFRYLKKPARILRRSVLFTIILPLYKIYTAGKKIVTKFYAPQFSRHPLIHLFSRRYWVHVVIVVIASLTVSANLNAYEVKRDELGRGSIAAQLIATEDLGSIAEEGPLTETRRVSHYMNQAAVQLTPQLLEEDGLINEPTTTVGGSAVVGPILSPAEEDIRGRSELVYHTVQPGDTISQIAEQYGISVNTILWENNLTAYSPIRPGDKLAILPQTGIRHKVASGDTIAKIATKYDVGQQTIIEANRLASADDLRIGEMLLIPGGKKIIAQPTYIARPTPSRQSTPSAQQPTAVVSSGSYTWPNSCRRITQYFGWLHSGVDIACPSGVAIYAADGGEVVRAESGWNGGYGNVIIIDHGNGIQTLYGHLSKIYVEVGDTVEKGEEIGAEGNTGRSTGPHLHFEVRVGGVKKNPLYYVD